VTWSNWSALAAICALGAVSPGPSLVVMMKHTVGASRAHGVAAALGHGCGVALYALLSVLGLSAVLTTHRVLFGAVVWAGAGYLAFLGVKMLASPTGGVVDLSVQPHGVPLRRAARDGLAVSLVNPKLAVFFVALFSQFVGPGSAPSERLVLVMTPAGIDTLWHVLVVLLVSQSRVLSWLRSHVRWLNRAMGVALILLGLRIVVT